MVLIVDGESVFRYVYTVKLRMTDDDWQGWDGGSVFHTQVLTTVKADADCACLPSAGSFHYRGSLANCLPLPGFLKNTHD